MSLRIAAFEGSISLKLGQPYLIFNPDLIDKYVNDLTHNPEKLLAQNIKSLSADNKQIANIIPKLQDNPFVLFNECYADWCVLNRLSTYGKYRSKASQAIVDALLATDCLNMVVVEPGHFFFDLVTLTNYALKKKSKHLEINYYCPSKDLIETLNVKETSEVKWDFIFDVENKNHNDWAQLLLLRLNIFITWFNSIDLDLTINIFQNKAYLVQRTPLLVGIDYVDDSPHAITDFYELAFSLAKNSPEIKVISLRHNGMGANRIFWSVFIIKDDIEKEIAKYYQEIEIFKNEVQKYEAVDLNIISEDIEGQVFRYNTKNKNTSKITYLKGHNVAKNKLDAIEGQYFEFLSRRISKQNIVIDETVKIENDTQSCQIS